MRKGEVDCVELVRRIRDRMYAENHGLSVAERIEKIRTAAKRMEALNSAKGRSKGRKAA